MTDTNAQPVDNDAPAPRFGLLKYTLVRVLLFAVVTAVLWLIGIRANIWVLMALGLAVSGLISFFLLNRTRDAASSSLSGVFKKMNQRIDASARAEDESVTDLGSGSDSAREVPDAGPGSDSDSQPR